jgi:hypothetical protein
MRLDSRRWTIVLLDGRLWSHDRPCRRQTEFPSWTWLGWSGEPRWFIPDVGELVGGVEICLMEIWVELAGEEKKKRIHWEEFQAQIQSEDLRLEGRWYRDGGES